MQTSNQNKILKEKGLKNTPTRRIILEIFKKNREPLNAGSLYKKVNAKKKFKKTNMVTIYRNLISLERGEIIKRVDLRKDSLYFEIIENHHHHIICTKCETTEDFNNENLEKLLKKIKPITSKFKKIKDHSVELFGLCIKCA